MVQTTWLVTDKARLQSRVGFTPPHLSHSTTLLLPESFAFSSPRLVFLIHVVESMVTEGPCSLLITAQTLREKRISFFQSQHQTSQGGKQLVTPLSRAYPEITYEGASGGDPVETRELLLKHYRFAEGAPGKGDMKHTIP